MVVISKVHVVTVVLVIGLVYISISPKLTKYKLMWSSGKCVSTDQWVVGSIPALVIEFFEAQDESDSEIELVREVIYLTDSELDSGIGE